MYQKYALLILEAKNKLNIVTLLILLHCLPSRNWSPEWIGQYPAAIGRKFMTWGEIHVWEEQKLNNDVQQVSLLSI